MRVLPIFAAGLSFNALSVGVQLVLVAWLAASTLQLPAGQLGWVQAAALLPNLLLLLSAGVIADRLHAGAILVMANVGLALCHLFALLCYLSGALNLATLLVYAFSLGVGNAFVQTAREKLVAQLGHDDLQRVISLAGICQFTAQGVGIGAASFTDWLGPPVLFVLQTGICLLAAVTYASLIRKVPSGAVLSLRVRSAISEGFQAAWREVPVRHIMLLVGFNGLMHLGMFMVLLPLLARDVMNFGSLEYGFLQLSFVLGTVLSHLVMYYRSVQFPGQNILFSLLYTGVIGFGLSSQPTVFGLFALVFLWGVVAGISANLSRLVVQSLMPSELRGRTMSIYQLALFGMAPLGALLAGYVVEHASLWLAFRVIAYSSFALFALSLLSKGLWGVTVADRAARHSEP